jgi:hypothetical protein
MSEQEYHVIELENCNRCKQHKLHCKFNPLFQVYCEVCGAEAQASEDIHVALDSWNAMQKELATQLELELFSEGPETCLAA